jgi:hypothetical protein
LLNPYKPYRPFINRVCIFLLDCNCQKHAIL